MSSPLAGVPRRSSARGTGRVQPTRRSRVSPCVQPARRALVLASCMFAVACVTTPAQQEEPAVPVSITQPPVIPHGAWQAQAPVGHAADATRRNLAPGDSLRFQALHIVLVDMTGTPGSGTAVLQLRADGAEERLTMPGGAARNWRGYHIAVLAANVGDTGLGAGLAELEIATVASLPPHIAAATIAGDATYRLRVPHGIHTITLHHTGSPQPLRPDEDPAEKLRGLQSWGRAERNWWDVPYHFLIDLDGRVYEGRDYRYMGETNTRYDPSGHLLISVIGNYDLQEPTPAQIRAVTAMMAWGAHTFAVPIERIYGHGDLTETSCPGRHLRRYLDDGTFRRAVAARLSGAPRGDRR